MRKTLLHNLHAPLLICLIFLGVGFIFPEVASAQEKALGFVGNAFVDVGAWLAIDVILRLATLLTTLSGAILNFVIGFTVVDMAENITKANAVTNAWRTIRDVSNMAFIFVLLYAAIQMILGIGGNTRKLIVNVVIVALLINFSLFFTKVVIDVSNVLAITLYGAMAPGALDSNLNGGIANSLMEPLRLSSIMTINGDSVDAGGVNLGGSTLIIIGVMGAIVALMAAFVFFAIAIMFIIRFVALIFVMILSPIAFIAMILPALGPQAKKWRDALIGQSFFAPIYFLLTWIVIVIARGIFTGTGTLSEAFLGATTKDAQGNISIVASEAGMIVLMNFIVIIALIIASLMIAKEWANKAGPVAEKATKWLTGAAGTATMGSAGWLGRRTLGRVGQVAYENEWLRDKAPTSRMARLALAASKKTGSSTFDARATKVYDKISDTTKTSLGKSSGKGGFADLKKKRIDRDKKYADETFKVSDITLMEAEQKLASLKKTGTTRDIANAQAELDKLTGVSEDVLRQRELKNLRASGMSKKDARRALDAREDQFLQEVNRLTAGGMSQKEAEDDARARDIGWAPEAIQGKTNTRKGAYASKIQDANISIPGFVPRVGGESVPFSWTRRHLGFGPVTSESKLGANAIRKSMKDKKSSEKIADEIERQAREAADDSDAGGTTPPPTTGATPTGGTPPTP